MDAWTMIDMYLIRQSRLASPPSAIGFMLERARDGMGETSRNPHAEEESHIFFANLSYAMTRVLSEQERRVAFNLRTPCGHKVYERECRLGDLVLNQTEGGETIQETRNGERFLRISRDEEGKPREGWAWVLGSKPLYPDFQDCAKQLGLTFNQVRRLVYQLKTKLENSIQYEAMLNER